MTKREERARRRAEWEQLVGRAFRCSDGLVRWIKYLSTLDNFGVWWLEERSNTWHSGGTIKAAKWQGGEEVPAPQPGDRYKKAGATGRVEEYTVPQPGEAGAAEGGGQG